VTIDELVRVGQKSEDVEWAVVKAEVYAAIMDHFASSKPLFTDAASASPSDTAIRDDDSDVVAMIKELLETRIKPAVAEDGGDILFKRFEEDTGRVVLKMQGACAGCPSSASTLKGGIEQMMRHYIPEVLEVVEAEPDEQEAEGLKAFSKLEQHLSN
jgi:NFU1 iron-sulfur cluster scaffold homolog, mitochondrial